MIIHHLKPSPIMIAGLVALLVIAAALVASYFRLRAIDPRVTMEFDREATGKQASTGQNVVATTIDGEVARTAERISEATALALSASLYVTSAQLSGRTPRGARDLVTGLSAQNLLPPGLVLTEVEGSLVSRYGNVSVRYRSTPLGIEVISLGHKPAEGPALIVRIPDEIADLGEAKLYIAGSLGDVRVPAPFSPAAEIVALGWSPEPLRSLK